MDQILTSALNVLPWAGISTALILVIFGLVVCDTPEHRAEGRWYAASAIPILVLSALTTNPFVAVVLSVIVVVVIGAAFWVAWTIFIFR